MTSASTFSEAPKSTELPYEPVIEAGNAEIAALPRRNPPPALDAAWYGFAADAVPVRAIFHRQAVRQIVEHSLSDTSSEVGGMLLGQAYLAEDGQLWVEIVAALPALSSDHGPIHFTITADAWAQVHRDRAVYYPALDIVGWFHTHPDLGVFYSADDVVVQTAGFTMPWHVGLVVDPLRSEAALFGWEQGEIAFLPGFYYLADSRDETEGLPWRLVRTGVWTDTYEEFLAQHDVHSQTAEQRILPWALSGGALVALLLFAVLFGMLNSANRRADALQAVTVTLLQERLFTAEAEGFARCHTDDLLIMSPLPATRLTLGTQIPVTVLAAQPGARGHELQARLAGAEWTTLEAFRWAENAEQVTVWDTTGYPAGTYELQLRAVTGEGQPMLAETCTILLELE